MTFFEENGAGIASGLAAFAATVVGAGVWVGRIATRVTQLESVVTKQQSLLTEEVRGLRDDIQEVGEHLQRSREEAMDRFAEDTDLKRIEEKVDSMRVEVAALKHRR